MKIALFVLLFGWQCVMAGDKSVPNEFVPDKSVPVVDPQATADELYEQGQDME